MKIDKWVTPEIRPVALGYACLHCGAVWAARSVVRECLACGSTELEPVEPDSVPMPGNEGA